MFFLYTKKPKETLDCSVVAKAFVMEIKFEWCRFICFFVYFCKFLSLLTNSLLEFKVQISDVHI